MKLVLISLAVALLGVCLCSASGVDDGPLEYREFQRGLEELSRKLIQIAESPDSDEDDDDLTHAGTEKREKVEKSREELETDDGKTDVADPDAGGAAAAPAASSSSGENVDDGKKKVEAGNTNPKGEVESTEDDDDDDDDDGPFPGTFPNIFTFFRSPSAKPWWQGPNVCVERNESQDEKNSTTSATTALGSGIFMYTGVAHFSSCENSPTRYVCTTVTSENGKTKKSVVTYQCCAGFKRIAGKQGCEEIEDKSLPQVAGEVNADEFEKIIEKENLMNLLSEGNLTVFMPVNAALEDYMSQAKKDLLSNSLLTNELSDVLQQAPQGDQSMVLSHIIHGLHEMNDLDNEMTLKTINNETTLRFNGYPGGIITVNCAEFNSTDKLTRAPLVVHSVNSVIPKASATLKEILSSRDFTKFNALLQENGLLEQFNGERPFTVFALKNDQVDKLDPKHAMCIGNILKHHILPHTVCSAAASKRRISTLDSAQNWMRMEMVQGADEGENVDEGQLVIDGDVKVTVKDIVAKDGVIHVVEDFIVPSSARSVSDLLEKSNHTGFLELLDKAGLRKEVDKAKDITLLVPVESNLKTLQALTGDELREALLYHVIKGKIDSDELDNDRALETKLGTEVRITSRANILGALLGQDANKAVQCSPMTRVDGRICNGVAHEILRPLDPASGSRSVLDVIQNSDELKVFRELLQGTDLEKELKERLDGDKDKEGGNSGPITILAPVNSAFDDLADLKEKLLKDKKLADAALRPHIIQDNICCSSVGSSSWPFISTVRTLDGSPLVTNRMGRGSQQDAVLFGSTRAVQCDNVARDGVVHYVDKLLQSAVTRNRGGASSGNGAFQGEEIIMRRPDSEIILGL